MAKPAGVVRHEHFFVDEDEELGRVDACETESGEFLTWNVETGKIVFCEDWLSARATAYTAVIRERLAARAAKLEKKKKRKKS